MTFQAVIFDLDGVLTDTAELHYQSWQRLADEEGLPFSRAHNERLRGLSRRDSLALLLAGRELAPARRERLLARKNSYYLDLLESLGPEALLPGIPALLEALAGAGLRVAVGSASQNARAVLEQLGVAGHFAVIADGHTPGLPKPAPDLFRHVAHALALAPQDCVVVEDAESGVAAALAGGLAVVGIGPAERVGQAHRCVAQSAALTLALLHEAWQQATLWQVVQTAWEPTHQRHHEALFTVGNGLMASNGVLEEGLPGEYRTTFVHSLCAAPPTFISQVVTVPDWMGLTIRLAGERFSQAHGTLLDFHRALDLRAGLLRRTVRWRSPAGRQTLLHFERFLSRTRRELLAIRLQVVAENWAGPVEVRGGLLGQPDNHGRASWQPLGQGQADGHVWLHSCLQGTDLEIALASCLAASQGAATVESWAVPGHPMQRLVAWADEALPISLTKRVALVGSRAAAPLAAAQQLLAETAALSFDALLGESRVAWGQLWEQADVELEGDDEAQRAIRLSRFQTLAVAPQQATDEASSGATALNSFGYRGHLLWDSDLFIV